MLKRFILTGLVLGFSVSLFSQVNPDTLPEKYVKKVIIEAKWGDGPGEFGYGPGGPGCGPSSIDIDAMGNIYILDNMHGAVKKYNTDGKLLVEYKHESFHSASNIVVDNTGNMYIETADATHNIILKYSLKDGSTHSFLFPCADISYRVKSISGRIIVKNKGKIVFDSKTFGKKQIGSLSASDIEYMDVQEDGSIMIKGYNRGYKGVRIDIPKEYSPEYYPLPKDKRIKIGLYYIGIDTLNNRYFYCSYSKIYETPLPLDARPEVKEVVYKYSPTGKLLAMVVLPEPEIYYEGPSIETSVRVNKKSNIYVMVPYKDGLKIYKFTQE